jgi:hypothetical protein
MFIWCRNPGSSGANYHDVSTSDFVLKPVGGSAAPAKFAEKVMNAKTVNTQGIRDSDLRFPAIITTLARFKDALVMSEAYEFSLTTNQKVVVKKNIPSNPNTAVIRGATTAQKTFMSEKDKETLERWLTQVPVGHQLTATKGPVLAPGFSMRHFFDVDKWWSSQFRAELSDKVNQYGQAVPTEQEWSQARTWFKEGVEKGLKEVDSHLSGFNWLSVKSMFRKYQARYGSDANMDWTNFKMRRVYIKAIRAYPKDPKKALAAVEAYANKKLNVDNKV